MLAASALADDNDTATEQIILSSMATEINELAGGHFDFVVAAGKKKKRRKEVRIEYGNFMELSVGLSSKSQTSGPSEKSFR